MAKFRKVFIGILSSALLLVPAACRKKQVMVPEDPVELSTSLSNGSGERPDSLHGYLFASHRLFYPIKQVDAFYFAAFGDPARQLSRNLDQYMLNTSPVDQQNAGNIRTGNVFFNQRMLGWMNFGPQYSLNWSNIQGGDNLAQWQVEGNKTFTGFRQDLSRGFPKLLDTMATMSATLSSAGFSIDMSTFFSDADSVAVRIEQNFNGAFINRSRPAASPVITFSSKDMLFMEPGNVILTLMGFNYSHMTVSGKRYLFVLNKRIQRSLQMVKPA